MLLSFKIISTILIFLFFMAFMVFLIITTAYELAPLVLAKVEAGRSLASACESVGLSSSAFKKWCVLLDVKLKIRKKGHSPESPWRGYKTL
jgi:hypothetical protein